MYYRYEKESGKKQDSLDSYQGNKVIVICLLSCILVLLGILVLF
jgi:hypothetical protein